MVYRVFKYTGVLFFIAVLYACTNNPFFGGDDYPANRLSIKGNVKLEGAGEHSGIFVWLEAVNAFTHTDSAGEFNLQMPSPERLPGGANAYSGSFKLYYYMSNFQYDSVTVLLRNGEVEFGQKSLDADGRVVNDVQLRRLIRISASVSPNTINLNSEHQDIEITIDIEPTIYGANLTTYFTDKNTLGAFIFARRDSLNLSRIHILPSSRPVNEFVNYRISGTDTVDLSLPAGTYEIVPFLKIEQDGLPEELITTISEFAFTLTYQYLYVPMKMKTEKLIVIN